MAKRPGEISDDEDEQEDVKPSSSKRVKMSLKSQGKQPARDHESDEEVQMQEERSDEDDANYETREKEKMIREIDERGEAKEIGQIAQMGIITKVVLDNFMCHTFLEVDLGPQVNFLTGKNGSGKSAVLTAIIVALGAKASATGRGAGIKGFIQTGKEQALVTVHIKNKGPEAYRHDVYGDEVIVCRSIHRTGAASTYKIKSSLGPRGKEKKTVSTKKEELDRVLDHMNIQVDNPINVLSQDAARAFLSNSGPKEKYDFFLKGTSLAQLAEEYDLVKVNIATIDTALRQKEVVLPEMKQTVRDAEKKVTAVEAGAALEQKLLAVEGELAWMLVAGKEEEFKKQQTAIADKEKKIRKLVAETTRIGEMEVQVVAETKAFEKEHARLQEELEPTRLAYEDANRNIKGTRIELRGIGAEASQMEADIKTLKAEIKGYQRQVDEETKRLEVDNSAEKAARQERIDEINHLINKTEARFPILQDSLKGLNERRDAIRAQLEDLDNEKNRIDSNVRTVAARKSNLENSQGGGPLAPYGRNIQLLLDEIKKRRWQGQLPIGPLGLGVKLKDPKYTKIVEAQLGNIFSSFAVTKSSDANELRKLFREYGSRHGVSFNVDRGLPPIIIFTPDPSLDISPGDLSRRGYTTLLSVLEIPNVHVRNIIVDRASAERTPIFATRQDASQAAQELGEGSTTLSMVPLYKVFVKQGTTSSNFISPGKGPGLFVADHKPEIQAASAELEDLRRQREGISHNRDQLRNDERNVNNEMSKVDREIQSHSSEVRKHRSNIANLNDLNRDQDPPNIAAFHDMIAEKTEAMDGLVAQLRDTQDSIQRIQHEAGPALIHANDLKKKMVENEAELKRIEEKIVQSAQVIVKYGNDVKHYEAKKVVLESEIAQHQSDADTIQEEVVDWTAEVSRNHPNRIDSNRSKQQVDGDVAGLKKSILQKKRDVGISLGDATSALKKASEAYQKAKKDIGEMKELHFSLVKALKLRGDKWHKFRRYIALRAKVLFMKNLSIRGFVGKLIFRHDLGMLNLRIQTDELASNATQSNEKNPNQLSGGEKSFSTVALLLSFWDAVGCPIRCLDEFDVFMDAVVRRQTLQMMMDTAKATDNTQFVLITPQDTSGVITSGSIKIIQMADPKRHEKDGAGAHIEDDE